MNSLSQTPGPLKSGIACAEAVRCNISLRLSGTSFQKNSFLCSSLGFFGRNNLFKFFSSKLNFYISLSVSTSAVSIVQLLKTKGFSCTFSSTPTGLPELYFDYSCALLPGPGIYCVKNYGNCAGNCAKNTSKLRQKLRKNKEFIGEYLY